jgi:hypothetical protein
VENQDWSAPAERSTARQRRTVPLSNDAVLSMPLEEEVLVTKTAYRCGCMRATTTAGYVAEELHCPDSLDRALEKDRLSRRRRRMDFEDPGLMPLLGKIEDLERRISRHHRSSGVHKSRVRPFEPEDAS